MADNAGRANASELVLPWPVRDLHPNARVHWARKAKASKKARRDAFLMAQEAGWHRVDWPAGRLHVWIDGYPRDRRRRDEDGMLSSLKSTLDGISDAMGIDDSAFVPHPWIKREIRKPGEIRIRVTGVPDE